MINIVEALDGMMGGMAANLGWADDVPDTVESLKGARLGTRVSPETWAVLEDVLMVVEGQLDRICGKDVSFYEPAILAAVDTGTKGVFLRTVRHDTDTHGHFFLAVAGEKIVLQVFPASRYPNAGARKYETTWNQVSVYALQSNLSYVDPIEKEVRI